MPYAGASAGSNLACPTIRTTNDMPIVEPSSLNALDLVPFQINPHYIDANPGSTHMGETRETRIMEFHEENSIPVVGLREGAMLRVDGDRVELRGSAGARIFRRGQSPLEVVPPADLTVYLEKRDSEQLSR
jgi:dipeptidase E